MTKNDCSLPPARSAVKRSANINDVIPGRPAGYRAQGSYVHPKQVAIDAKPVKFNAGTIGDDAKGMNFDPKRPDDDAKRIVFHPKSIDIDAKRTDLDRKRISIPPFWIKSSQIPTYNSSPGIKNT